MFSPLYRAKTGLPCPGATNSIGQLGRPVQNREIQKLNHDAALAERMSRFAA